MVMAKRYSSKKGRNLEPAVMTMTFATPIGPGQHTIDLSQVASILNRRFYRQGLNWAVGGFKFFSTNSGAVTIGKLPNTWVTANAWKKSFEAWNRQQREALAAAGGQSAAAKFRDFKIHMDVDHVSAGFAANLMPIDLAANVASPGEWNASEIVLPNSGAPGVTEERFLHMVGANVNGTVSRGMIDGYGDSRAYPQSPDPVSPDLDSSQNWLARMFDTGDDIADILDNATDHNDELPYPQVDYPGGAAQLPGLEYHDAVNLVSYSGTTNIGVQYGKGGNFPCGLIRIGWLPEGNANLVIQVDLVPGKHRGYLCEPMGDM